VSAGEWKILIDPGIALGYVRNGLLPHPLQIAVDERIREKIRRRWENATDIVISHFHGDHVPLVDANPYQLDARDVAGSNPGVRIWTKAPGYLSRTEKERFQALQRVLDAQWIPGAPGEGPIRLSVPVPHGAEGPHSDTVMMTRICGQAVFVHASDIQLLDDTTAFMLLAWRPDILLAGGPPLYLGRLTPGALRTAWRNGVRLAASVDRLILEHHLLRSREGPAWIRRLSKTVGREVLTAAAFMGHAPRLLEADRALLYEQMPVPEGWHEEYALGTASTASFLRDLPNGPARKMWGGILEI
jgi:hypothetical protein